MNIHKNARLTPLGRERMVRMFMSGQTPGGRRLIRAPGKQVSSTIQRRARGVYIGEGQRLTCRPQTACPPLEVAHMVNMQFFGPPIASRRTVVDRGALYA